MRSRATPTATAPRRRSAARPSSGGRTGRLLVAVLIASAACAWRRPGSADLRLESRSPPVVRHANEIELVLRNVTRDPIAIPRPSQAFLLVSTSTGEGRVLRCRTPPLPAPDLEVVVLEPGAALPIDVDPLERCEGVRSHDDVRVVVRFAVPSAVGDRPRGAEVWTGVTPPVHVQVVPPGG